MQNENEAVQILIRHYEEAKLRNPRLSKRGFAQRVGLSSGALSEIMTGKRPLTLAIKKKVAAKLQLSPEEEVRFFNDALPDSLRPQRQEHMQLSSDQFHLISDWWHWALLNLIRTKDFRPHVGWMAKRLGMSQQIVGDAWDRLFRLGFLAKSGTRIVRKHANIETSNDLFDLSIRKAHLEDLKLMENSLFEVPLNLRDHSCITLSVSRKDLPKAKEMIRLFQDQFAHRFEKTSGDEVYRLNVALFPLTQVLEEQ